MLEQITINGAIVTPDIDGNVHHYLLGAQGILQGGNALSCEIIDNNTIRIFDGLISNYGRFARVKPGTYLDMTINNSSPNVTRKDIIVCHFESDAVSESIDIRVLEGDTDGEEPEVTTGDLLNGDLVNEVILYKVTIDGIEGITVEDCRKILPSMNALSDEKMDVSTIIKTSNGLVELRGEEGGEGGNLRLYQKTGSYMEMDSPDDGTSARIYHIDTDGNYVGHVSWLTNQSISLPDMVTNIATNASGIATNAANIEEAASGYWGNWTWGSNDSYRPWGAYTGTHLSTGSLCVEKVRGGQARVIGKLEVTYYVDFGTGGYFGLMLDALSQAFGVSFTPLVPDNTVIGTCRIMNQDGTTNRDLNGYCGLLYQYGNQIIPGRIYQTDGAQGAWAGASIPSGACIEFECWVAVA